MTNNQFIDKQLITYTDYYEFLYAIKDQYPDRYRQMIPIDTAVTYKGKQLWNNKAFGDYPILGLQEHQMTRYCEWRSTAVNVMIHTPGRRCSQFDYWNKFDVLDPDKKYQVAYSLPTKAEILKFTPKKTKIHPAEHALDGSIPGTRVRDLSSPNLQGFRCKAQYVLRN